MSPAPRRNGRGVQDRTERLQSWTGVLVSALLHLLLLLLVLWAPPITVTSPPEGGDAGSRMEVTYIDDTLRPPSPTPPATPAPPRKPAEATPPAVRVQTTPVDEADDSTALRVVDIPATAPEPTPTPPDAPARTAKRPGHVWGQPPGMLPEDHAPVNAGRARSPAVSRGRNRDAASSGTSMAVGGYQVYYDLLDETRLRAWRDDGMTELFLPLPGTQRLMVCPLETALRSDSGECRLVEPDDPGLADIGDARDVITMQRVYRLGEVLWSGPGAYR